MFGSSGHLPDIQANALFFLTQQNTWVMCTTNVFLKIGTFLAAQWLRLHSSISGGFGPIPGEGTKIPHAMRGKKNKK